MSISDAVATATLPRPRCPACGHRKHSEGGVCAWCGATPERQAPRRAPRAMRALPALDGATRVLLLGALLAPVFTFTPLLRYMGWFLSSLVHEIGHCAAAWAAGCAAVPAISLAGHAMAAHSAQSTALCLVLWALLGGLTWRFRAERGLLVLLGSGTLLYPLFAFTGLREVVFLLAGHLGELAFATIFFWRAAVGGFSDSGAERATHATVAWYLFGHNVWLAGGLLTSGQVRSWYASSGSFGLTNDYIRLAREVLHLPLGAVAFGMLVLSLAVPAAAWALARRYRG